MKKIQITPLILAFLVIISFSIVGVTIAYRSILWSSFFLLVGFGVMGYGMGQKRKTSKR
ncbi:DUF5325 family protein [Bacillaceae bacterium S4-13-58]